jgi:CDP-diacylglycerol---glycerol-3-phosphate 3-phosphatidyltransferase
MTYSNRLTLIRLSLAPVFFILFWIEKHFANHGLSLSINITLIILATISEITDALDGKIARKRKEVTDFGKLFDPFADSVSRFTFFLCFWWSNLIPAWMVIIIFYRDACVSFLRLVLRGENVVLAARRSGKIKAVLQSIAIICILLGRVCKILYAPFPLDRVVWWIMLIVVGVTIYSFVDYVLSHKKILSRIPK